VLHTHVPFSQVKVPGDDHCFYHVVIDWLHTHKRGKFSVTKLRNDLADFMEKQRSTIEPFMIDTSFDGCVEGVRANAWADNAVQAAAARMFSVRIRIISPNAVTIIEPPGGATDMIDLAHDPGVHFDGARKIEAAGAHQGTSKKPGYGKSWGASANTFASLQGDEEDEEDEEDKEGEVNEEPGTQEDDVNDNEAQEEAEVRSRTKLNL
jgi:OTU-like cysteine protease